MEITLSGGTHRTSLGLTPNSAGSCFLEQVAAKVHREGGSFARLSRCSYCGEDSHSVKTLSRADCQKLYEGSELQAWEMQPLQLFRHNSERRTLKLLLIRMGLSQLVSGIALVFSALDFTRCLAA